MLGPLPGSHAWLFDLVARDDEVRRRALTRHQELVAAASAAVHWSNRIFSQAGRMWIPTEPHLAAEMDQAWADLRWHKEQTINGPLEAFLDWHCTEPALRARYAEFVVLYLQWEADYAHEWVARASSMWSPWGTKEQLLYQLDRRGVPEQVRPQIGDLIIAALRRPYRCKDWIYARLVAHVLDASFTSRVESLLGAEDPLVRLRAEFVLHVARHPAERVKRVSWRRWLASDTGAAFP